MRNLFALLSLLLISAYALADETNETTPPKIPAEAAPAGNPEHHLWLSVGAGAGLLAGADDPAITEVTRLGFGWTNDFAYARLSAGFLLGTPIGQGRGLETSLGLGWVALPWLQVGLTAGHRISSAQIADPWADQCWFVGVEGAQKLLSLDWGLELWVEESLAGGQWVTRAIEAQDQLVFVPQEDHGAFRLDVAIVLKQAL